MEVCHFPGIKYPRMNSISSLILSPRKELKKEIRKTLRENASPRHVPALILEAPEIPYTLNMKKVESAVTNIINGRTVTNKDALINPGSLDYYEKILPEIK